MRLSIKSMRYFARAVQLQSIARASEELNVVPSAVSGAIDQVEAEFGLKLVHRFPAKGISPTAAGKSLLVRVTKLMEEYDGLMRDGNELRASLSGELRIGYYAPIAPAFLPSILGGLMGGNSEVSVSLVECNNESAQAGLLAGQFDVILFVASNVRQGIEYKSLIAAPPFVLTARDNPLAKRSGLTIDDLQDAPLVLLDLPFTSEYLRSLLERMPGKPNIVAKASSTEMVRSLVGAGVGSAIHNMRPPGNVTYAGEEVRAVPLLGCEPLRLVLGHTGGSQRRLVTAFTEACAAYFESEAAQALVVNPA